MDKRLSPNEAKHLVHAIEFAKSRNFYAEQNRRANAKAIYDAESRANRKYRGENKSTDSFSISEAVIGSSVMSLLLSVANEFVNLNNMNFLYNLGALFILFFLGYIFCRD